MPSLSRKDGTLDRSSSLSAEISSAVEAGKVVPVATTDLSSLEDLSRDLRHDPEARAAFLSTFSAEEGKKIMRKVDIRFCPLIGIMFMIKNIDFGNIGIVKTMQAGQPSKIMTELGFPPNQYNWVATIQGIPYVIFELPSNLLLKYMTPHAWESRIFLTWGIVTACCGAVRNRGQFTRATFLGRAGIFPGVITTLSYWYRTDEVGRPMVWYFTISNLSTIVGSLICYGASFMNGMRGLSGWRWALILEGVATVLFAAIIYLVLPDFPKSPRSGSWLTPREQQFLEARLPPHDPATADPSWNTKEAWVAFTSPTTWAFLFDQTLKNLGNYVLSRYLPTIIAGLGFARLPNSLLLNIPPAAACIGAIFICLLITSRAWAPRPLLCIAIVIGTIICFILFFTVSSRGGLYVACVLSQFFMASYYVPYWSWRTSIMSGSTGASFAIGLQSSIAQLGSTVGPQIFQSKWAYNRYRNSFIIGCARDIESRVIRVRRNTLKERREGKAYQGVDDIDVLGDDRIKNRSWW